MLERFAKGSREVREEFARSTENGTRKTPEPNIPCSERNVAKNMSLYSARVMQKYRLQLLPDESKSPKREKERDRE